MEIVSNQEQFTAQLQETLEHLALENAKTLAAQLTAMVVTIQTGQQPRAALFFEEGDIPDEWLDMADIASEVKWAVLIPDPVLVERWAQHDAQVIDLPDGKTVVLGYM